MRKKLPQIVFHEGMKIDELVNEINSLLIIIQRMIGADDYLTSEPNGTIKGTLGESAISLISGVYSIHKCYGGTLWKKVTLS